MMLKKIGFQYIAGCAFGAIGFLCFAFGTASLEKVFFTEIFFGGDQSVVFSGLFLGIPIGALVGVSVLDKLVYRKRSWNIFGLIAGFLLGWCGILLAICLLDIFDFKMGVLLGLLETICFILIGYHLNMIFPNRKIGILFVVSILLGNLLAIYSSLHLDYFGKVGLVGVIFFMDLFLILLCIAVAFYASRHSKGERDML